MNKPVALTIAGSDPTGGAGVQADLKTFAAHNVYGASVISVLSAQNTERFELFPVSTKAIAAQIDAAFEAFEIKAIKIGMLSGCDVVRAVITALDRHNGDRAIPVVLDPIIRASNGGVALDRDSLDLARRELIPRTTLIKPNLPEAAQLLGEPQAQNIDEMEHQAKRLFLLGCSSLLLSGGHLAGRQSVDIFVSKGENCTIRGKKLDIAEIHGTGCTLTAAIAANLAKGLSVRQSVDLGKAYLDDLLLRGTQLDLAGQNRSLDHLRLSSKKGET